MTATAVQTQIKQGLTKVPHGDRRGYLPMLGDPEVRTLLKSKILGNTIADRAAVAHCMGSENGLAIALRTLTSLNKTQITVKVEDPILRRSTALLGCKVSTNQNPTAEIIVIDCKNGPNFTRPTSNAAIPIYILQNIPNGTPPQALSDLQNYLAEGGCGIVVTGFADKQANAQRVGGVCIVGNKDTVTAIESHMAGAVRGINSSPALRSAEIGCAVLTTLPDAAPTAEAPTSCYVPQLLNNATEVPTDHILTLGGEFRKLASIKPDKKVGGHIGIIQDQNGREVVPACVEAAIHGIAEKPTNDRELGALGDIDVCHKAWRWLTGRKHGRLREWQMAQVVSGSGGLAVAAILFKELFGPNAEHAAATPDVSWPNHPGSLEKNGVPYTSFRHRMHFKSDNEFFNQSLQKVKDGSFIHLQIDCDNPTGVNIDNIAKFAAIAKRKKLFVCIDIAYPNLGIGLHEERKKLAAALKKLDNVFVNLSFSKTAGLYNERLGAVFFKVKHTLRLRAAKLLPEITTALWGAPPSFPAEVMNHLLTQPGGRARLRRESDAMREEYLTKRRQLFIKALEEIFPGKDISFAKHGNGMFVTVPKTLLGTEKIQELRSKHNVYLTDGGRFVVCALTDANYTHFIASLIAVTTKS